LLLQVEEETTHKTTISGIIPKFKNYSKHLLLFHVCTTSASVMLRLTAALSKKLNKNLMAGGNELSTRRIVVNKSSTYCWRVHCKMKKKLQLRSGNFCHQDKAPALQTRDLNSSFSQWFEITRKRLLSNQPTSDNLKV
jgi:hypothetical protein